MVSSCTDTTPKTDTASREENDQKRNTPVLRVNTHLADADPVQEKHHQRELEADTEADREEEEETDDVLIEERHAVFLETCYVAAGKTSLICVITGVDADQPYTDE